MSVILLDKAVVHYEALGRGRPVILVHGWMGSWRYWISAMQTLSSTYRVYAVDLWGFGDSSRRTTHYGFEQQAALLADFRDQMGIGKTALVGHGLGAAVALEYARNNPASVDRVMAVSYPQNFQMLQSRLEKISLMELAGVLLVNSPGAELIKEEMIKTDPAVVRLLLAQMTGLLQQEVAWVGLPTCLIVNGIADEFAHLLPPAQQDILPHNCHEFPFDQSGHFPMLDEEFKFNRLLMEFLALESGASPRQLQLKEEWKRRVR